jgi:hypothetical protein
VVVSFAEHESGQWLIDDRRTSGTARGKLTFVSDTSPKATTRYFELLRQAGLERRLEICLGLSRATRELAIAGIKLAHPDRLLLDDELRHKLAERLYGVEIARRVFAGRVG